MIRYLFFALILSSLFFSSCRSHKDLIYFQNLDNYPDSSIYEVLKYNTPTINYGDILAINVYSFDPRASIPFNNHISSTSEAEVSITGSPEYLISEDGKINFPVLGSFPVVGLTQKEVEEVLIDRLKEGYIKDPVVDVRLVNFNITVLGEVGSGIIEIPNNRVNIIEALAMAGDISIYGDRKNVLLIREEDGKREFARVDITDAGIFNSPYFNLQNNDIIYLEPLKYKTTDQNQERVTKNIGFVSFLVTTATFLITLFAL
ncbi:MAG: polysaccharide export outer membrane protein [Ulvibacter sp.]